MSDLWQRLSREKRPILIYGMGDGADKIIDMLDACGKRPSAVFASDGFARGNEFRGFRVGNLADALLMWGDDVVIVPAFASSLPDVMAHIEDLDKKFTLIMPDLPPVAGEPFTEAYAAAHDADITAARALLCGGESRRVFDGIIGFRLSGDIGLLRHSSIDELLDIVKPAPGAVVADLGAYDGDTARLFAERWNCSRIVAVEPDAKNFAKLSRYAAGDAATEPVLAAVSDAEKEVSFSVLGGRNSRISYTGNEKKQKSVRCVTVDGLLAGGRADVIKMDVEGEEAAALRGAADTLRRFSPSLMIASYHRTEDIFALPLLIESICPGVYDFFLRKLPYYPAWDIFLLCRPKEAAYVYMVRCADGSLYCGWARNVEHRLAEHNQGSAGAKYTRSRRPVSLAYVERLPSKSEALKREAEIKSLCKQKKEALAAEWRSGV